MSGDGQSWDAGRYARDAAFVPELGRAVLDLLAPLPGERVLDLGCGDGALTWAIREAGAEVVGVDGSASMAAAARARGLDARLADGHALAFDAEFDAVFSNAALHWMTRPDAAIDGVARALRPGGRFVAEFGGHGNVAAIRTALAAILAERGHDAAALSPWYFPTPEAYGALLAARGFVVERIESIPRSTPLPTDMSGWLATFAEAFFRPLAQDDQDAARDETLALLRPILCDDRGRWTADYVRLRFRARVPG